MIEGMEYIADGDIGFLKLAEGEVAKTVHRQPEILVDLDAKGRPLSIEVIGYSTTPKAAVQKVVEEFQKRVHIASGVGSLLVSSVSSTSGRVAGQTIRYGERTIPQNPTSNAKTIATKALA